MRWCLLLLLIGCTDLGEFSSNPDKVYRGTITGTDEVDCPEGTTCSFIRRGFAVETVLELDFDPQSPEPGTLTTLDEPCGLTLDGERLHRIPPLEHDTLSLFDFPGEARLRNYMFALAPESGPLAGRDGMAFVSLIRGGDIEVRVVVGSGQNDCDPDDCAAIAAGGCDYFGLFRTRRRDR